MVREQPDRRLQPSPSLDQPEENDTDGESSLSRRSYLAVAAAAFTGGVAGCIGGGDDVSKTAIQPMTIYGFGGEGVYQQSTEPLSTESETNDDPSQANPILLDTPISGYLDTDDVDWFSFEATSGYDLTIELDREPQSGVVGLLLYGPDGTLIDVVVAASDAPVNIAETASETGHHFVGVVDINDGTGSYYVTVTNGEETTKTTTTTEPVQAPYGGTTHAIPGTVQAEHFDEGGEGIAYHDTNSVSKGTDFRTDTGVDVEESYDSTDDLSVGWVNDGEWLEYTVDVTPGTYDVHARVATKMSDRRLRVKLDGETVGLVDVPNTGGWYSWETVTLEDVRLFGGSEQILRIETVGDGTNLNWVRFDPKQIAYGSASHTIPGTVQAEHFDEGGEGIAYHDTNSVSKGTDFRTDTGVDVEESYDSTDDLSVGWVNDGEWLEYTVDVTPGTYDIQARVATKKSDRRLRVKLDGETVGLVDVPNTGGWYSWETATLNDVYISAENQHVLRVEAVGSGSNLNWVRFAPAEPTSDSTTDSTTTTTTTVTTDDDFGEQAYGQYGYGGISS